MKKALTLIFIFLTLSIFSQDCSTPTGFLRWDKPTGFNSSEDFVLVFAKKVPLRFYESEAGIFKKLPVRINIENPTKDPTTYGVADTSLSTLEGAIAVQYENDPLAMLVYSDTGDYVKVSGLEDSTYVFITFNVDDGLYSNAKYSIGETIAINPIKNIVLSNSSRLQWVKPVCPVTDTIVAVLSEDSISIVPTGFASNYLTGVNINYNQNTSFFNGVDDTQGKVMYVDFGDRMFWKNLPEKQVWIFLWINRDDCWSKARYKVFDTR